MMSWLSSILDSPSEAPVDCGEAKLLWAEDSEVVDEIGGCRVPAAATIEVMLLAEADMMLGSLQMEDAGVAATRAMSVGGKSFLTG